jgi:hypothetical protein
MAGAHHTILRKPSIGNYIQLVLSCVAAMSLTLRTLIALMILPVVLLCQESSRGIALQPGTTASSENSSGGSQQEQLDNLLDHSEFPHVSNIGGV